MNQWFFYDPGFSFYNSSCCSSAISSSLAPAQTTWKTLTMARSAYEYKESKSGIKGEQQWALSRKGKKKVWLRTTLIRFGWRWAAKRCFMISLSSSDSICQCFTFDTNFGFATFPRRSDKRKKWENFIKISLLLTQIAFIASIYRVPSS